jgi:coenzyme F420-dependent oxidoreductase
MGTEARMTLELVLMTRDHETPASVVDRARDVLALGFDRVATVEATGWNAATLLSLVAHETEDVGIANDVYSPFARTPALIAQTALTLDAISTGRYRLGLGPSSPPLTEGWHGVAFDTPLRRLRETVDIVRGLFGTGSIAYDGEVFSPNGEVSYDRDTPVDPPAIDLATLGPKATELAGRVGDGWVPQLFTAASLGDRLTDLERGAKLGGRTLADVRVSPIVRCFATTNDVDDARERARATLSFLIGAYGPYYGDSVARQGYPEVVEAVRSAWTAGDRGAMAAAIPDELLSSLVAVGRPSAVRRVVRTYQDVGGVDAVRAGFLPGMTEREKRTTMQALVDRQ